MTGGSYGTAAGGAGGTTGRDASGTDASIVPPSLGMSCTNTQDCPANATCCDGSKEICDGTKLPSGDGANSGQFVVSADGLTVTDTITGLVWQRDGWNPRDGCPFAGNLLCTWAQAQAYCASLALGGMSGWRVPARMELVTIVDFTRENPTLDMTAFPITSLLASGLSSAGSFWTSSPDAFHAGSMWLVDFYSGNSDRDDASQYHQVRCVR